MRAPIYRNLDQSFQIMGFSVVELLLLAVVLVGGGELLPLFGIHRAWALVVTLILAVSFFGLRRSLGERFVLRLGRFLRLPSQLRAKLFLSSKRGFES